MNAKLTYSLLEATPVKGMIVLVEVEVDGNTIEVFEKITTINEDNVILSDGRTVSIEYIKNRVVKFIAALTKSTLSVQHGSYNSLFSFFKQNPEQEQTFIESKRSFNIDGKVNSILNAAKVGYSVCVCSLFIVDKFKLYDKSYRYGTIEEVFKTENDKGVRFKVKLAHRTLILKRADFTLVDKNDRKLLFKLDE